jgi:hypothetical protein
MTPLISLARSARRLRIALAFSAAAISFSCAAPASAEVVYALFDQPDGGVTVGTYSGIVSVTVSGVGQSLADLYNDAFYLLPAGSLPAFSGLPITNFLLVSPHSCRTLLPKPSKTTSSAVCQLTVQHTFIALTWTPDQRSLRCCISELTTRSLAIIPGPSLSLLHSWPRPSPNLPPGL